MIDHFVLGVAQLESGMRCVADATGVDPVLGGRHTQLGTHNALVALGERQYLEILAPDPTQPVLVDALTALRGLTVPTLVKWAAATDDVDRASELMRGHGFAVDAVERGSRTRSDGKVLHWRQVGFLSVSSLDVPFVIEWGAGSVHPAEDSPGGCAVARFTVSSPRSAALSQLCTDLGAAVTVRRGAVARLELVLDTLRGVVELTS